MMSELQPAAHGRKKPQTERLLKREKTWMAIRSAPFATPENALPAGAPLSGDDAGDVRAMLAAEKRAVDPGSGTHLVLLAVGAQCGARSPSCWSSRPPRRPYSRGTDASTGRRYRERRRPSLIRRTLRPRRSVGADAGHALGERCLDDSILHDPRYRAHRLESRQRIRPDLECDEGKGLKPAVETVARALEGAEYDLVAASCDLISLARRRGLARQESFGDEARAREPHLDDDRRGPVVLDTCGELRCDRDCANLARGVLRSPSGLRGAEQQADRKQGDECQEDS